MVHKNLIIFCRDYKLQTRSVQTALFFSNFLSFFLNLLFDYLFMLFMFIIYVYLCRALFLYSERLLFYAIQIRKTAQIIVSSKVKSKFTCDYKNKIEILE